MVFKGFTKTLTLLMILLIDPEQLYSHTTNNIGCHYNGTWYADKSVVLTTEKCLNCQCSTNTLVCRLKVCPEMPIPPPRGCVLVQKKSTCCPYLSCANFDTFQKIPITRRIIAYLDQYERESIDRVINENILQGRSDDNEIDLYVCVKNGTVYKSGSAMSSSNLCSYCYCIGGTEKCVRPKCMLPVSGCKPIFVDSTCCPVRYDCSSKSTGKSSQEVRYRKTSNKHYLRTSQRYQRNRGCTINKNYYPEGHKMKSDPDKPCTVCFCIRGQRKCAPKKCSPALKNCIPVIPKGQCCPSSYDCGYYGRASNSRQFNLFSLLFGNDDEQTINNTDISVKYPTDKISTEEKPSATTEGSILDAIRKGLEFIDNNTQNIEHDVDTLPFSTTFKPVLEDDDTFSYTELNVIHPTELDVNKQSNITNQKLLIKDNSIEPFDSLTSTTELVYQPDYEDSTKDILSTTLSDAGNYDFYNTTDNSDLISITTDSYTTDDSTTEENLPETTSYSTIINDMDITQTVILLNNTSQKVQQLLNSTILDSVNQKETFTVLDSIKNELSSIKPEKKADFLDVLLTGLSDIFGGEKLKSNASLFVTTEQIKVSTDKTALPPFRPLPVQDKVPTRINSKIASLTSSHHTDVIKGVLNVTKSNPSIIILPEPQDSLIPSISISSSKNYTINNKMPFTFDVMSAPIKMNPTILDTESFEDMIKPTLPPSLPNLKIIPFLPTDAVKGDHHKFYHQNPTVNARIDYNLYDDANIYPSITEKHPLYNNLEDDSKAEYIYKFNVEGPDALLPDFQASVLDKPVKGFSPPTKTEGGFIPKEPLILDNKPKLSNDNLDTIHSNINDNFHLKPLRIDITTAYALNTTKLIEITTPDPFKDVIKTEPPPDLTLLIEDKKKNNLLLSPAPSSISVTVEKSYILPSIIEVNLTNTQPTEKKRITPDNLETQIGLVINVQPTTTVVNKSQNFDIQNSNSNIEGEIVNSSVHNIQIKSNTQTLNTKYHEANVHHPIITTTEVGPIYNIKSQNNQNNIERQPISTTISAIASMSLHATKRMTYKSNTSKTTRITPKIKVSNRINKTKNSLMMMTTPLEPSSSSSSSSTSTSSTSTATTVSISTMRPALNITRRIVNLQPVKSNRNKTVPTIKKHTVSGLMTLQIPSSTSRVTTNMNTNIYSEQNTTETSGKSHLIEQSPFYNDSSSSPFLSFMDNGLKIGIHNSSKFENTNSLIDSHSNIKFIGNVQLSPLNQRDKLKDSYDVQSPKPFHYSSVTTQRIEQPQQLQPHKAASHNLVDPAGILKLAGCNIYGRMYRVGRIIIELSNPCLECRCTEIGVKCNPLDC